MYEQTVGVTENVDRMPNVSSQYQLTDSNVCVMRNSKGTKNSVLQQVLLIYISAV